MIKIGKIVNTQGIKGEVRVLSNSDFKDIRFEIGNTLFIEMKNETIKVEIEKYHTHKNFDILKFKNFNNINDVLKFKNYFLYGEELEETVLADDEYFISELIGLDVFDEMDKQLGKIIDVIDNGVQMLLKIGNEKKSFFVPYVDEFILDIDLESNKMIIKVIKGLIDED